LLTGLREFAGAALVERGEACFLIDPHWGARERSQWTALAEQTPPDWDGREGWLCIPTGGSSGALKLARHDEHTLGAAVEGFCQHFGVERVDALGLLPPWHVSGLLAWARCAWTGGTYRALSWKEVEAGARPVFGGGGAEACNPAASTGAFVSLVPTQVARLLGNSNAEAWLRGFYAVLVGGGPVWPELCLAARAARLPLCISYGMTETAAMVTALRPEEFLAGRDDAGQPLPHLRLTLEKSDAPAEPTPGPTSAPGRIALESASLFRGYWPGRREGSLPWLTEDLGEMTELGGLRVRGRRDALIVTGGEKVDPAEVTALLRKVAPEVEVIGLPHPDWGNEVVAIYPLAPGMPPVAEATWRTALEGILAPAKRPKRLISIPLADWPRNAQGKVPRAALAALAARTTAISQPLHPHPS